MRRLIKTLQRSFQTTVQPPDHQHPSHYLTTLTLQESVRQALKKMDHDRKFKKEKGQALREAQHWESHPTHPLLEEARQLALQQQDQAI